MSIRILKLPLLVSLFVMLCLSNVIVFAQTDRGANSSSSLFNSVNLITNAIARTLVPSENGNGNESTLSLSANRNGNGNGNGNGIGNGGNGSGFANGCYRNAPPGTACPVSPTR